MLIDKDPDFFKYFSDKIDKEKFYNYSYQILLDIAKYKITGTLKKGEEWKKKLYLNKKIVAADINRMSKIFEIYNRQNSYYFSEKNFMSRILMYFLEGSNGNGKKVRTLKE